MVSGRENDTFGIGYFAVGPSSKLPGLFIDVSHGEGFEFYYDIALAPWWHLTPDLQVIESAAKGIDTAVVLGLRTKIDF